MSGPKVLIVDDNSELLALLAHMLEDAGYTPLPFSRGRPAMERIRIEKPALAILDLLLPDVMGFEVAAVCRRELQIPVIFVTGVFKGGRHALDAKVKYDALGYFEKPFEAALLLQTIRGVVSPATPPIPTESADEVGIEIEIEEQVERDPLELTGRISLREEGGLSATLQGNKLTAAAPHRSPLKVPTPVPPTSLEGRSGELSDNLPSLITAFYLAQKTGELALSRGNARKVVYFEGGQPVFALSNVTSDRFAQFLFRVGKITAGQLEEVLGRLQENPKPKTGEVLMQMQLLKETERLYYVGQQVKSIIYSLFAWENGRYQMTFRDQTVEQAIKLDLPPATLIMRGVKKLYKLPRLQRLVGPVDRLMPTRDPPYQLSELSLESWEARLLPHLDGTRTVTQIQELAQRPEATVLGSLVALLSLHLVTKRPPT